MNKFWTCLLLLSPLCGLWIFSSVEHRVKFRIMMRRLFLRRPTPSAPVASYDSDDEGRPNEFTDVELEKKEV
jgi:hypothetical protein